MSFDLFGFDFLHEDCIYGFWVGAVRDYKDFHRSLLCLHCDNGCLRLEICYIRIV